MKPRPTSRRAPPGAYFGTPVPVWVAGRAHAGGSPVIFWIAPQMA